MPLLPPSAALRSPARHCPPAPDVVDEAAEVLDDAVLVDDELVDDEPEADVALGEVPAAAVVGVPEPVVELDTVVLVELP